MVGVKAQARMNENEMSPRKIHGNYSHYSLRSYGLLARLRSFSVASTEIRSDSQGGISTTTLRPFASFLSLAV